MENCKVKNKYYEKNQGSQCIGNKHCTEKITRLLFIPLTTVTTFALHFKKVFQFIWIILLKYFTLMAFRTTVSYN